MPSLRKRVSSYFRQLSFHNEPKDKRHAFNENSFVTKYLEGHITLREGPRIVHGKNPTDLPNYELDNYSCGYDSIVGCYSGPNGGLTTVKRIEKHLSVLESEIDFIDTPEDDEAVEQICSTVLSKPSKKKPVDNTTMVIKVAGQEYCVTNRSKRHSKSQSLGSLADFNIEIEKTRIDKDYFKSDSSGSPTNPVKDTPVSNKKSTENYENILKNTDNTFKTNVSDLSSQDVTIDLKTTGKTRENCVKEKRQRFKSNISENIPIELQNTNQKRTTVVKNRPSKGVPKKATNRKQISESSRISDGTNKTAQNYCLAKSKSEGNPFHKEKTGKIIKVDYRSNIMERNRKESDSENFCVDDTCLPDEWNRKTDLVYGLSDSLYDRNQVTKNKNGDPIADCFGIIARKDSAILAVADGVNWGEKASIAAKSAVHGCLYYLNKTLFNDTKLFDGITVRDGNSEVPIKQADANIIHNTKEVFVCLLRAFTCAHDLILENNGMLTTLTVAVILPLKPKYDKVYDENNRPKSQYICCVCNVGDTLAYVYSQESGLRELTKGSHDITSNRDMRDALGALGPVDGTNPELSNLTISLTTIQTGDVIMIASDGLTDNFDPKVCRFATNSDCFQSNIEKKSNIKSHKEHNQAKSSHQSGSKRNHTNKNNSIPPVSQRPQQNHSFKRSSSAVSPKEKSHIENVPIVVSNTPSEFETCKQNICTTSEEKNNMSIPQIKTDVEMNPLVEQFILDNALDKTTLNQEKSRPNPHPLRLQNENIAHHSHNCSSNSKTNQTSTLGRNNIPTTNKTFTEKNAGYKFLRSKTSLDISYLNKKQIPRDEDGIPYITPVQRYELQLLLIEDILRRGISGKETPCTTAKRLCENLVNFTFSITSAKRRTLEDPELYFDNRNGLLVEVSSHEKKIRRKKALEKVQNLPGKLDHVTAVAYNVGYTAF